MELHNACLHTLSSLSETSCAAQVHWNYQVVEVRWGIRGVISSKAVLTVPLLSLVRDKSSHLVVVSLSENLSDCLLRDDTVDCSLLQDLVVVAGGWFENVFPYTGD